MEKDIFKRLGLMCFIISTTFGLSELYGWLLALQLMVSYRFEYISMAPTTAIIFILLGSALCFYSIFPRRRVFKVYAVCITLLVLFFSSLKLIEFFSVINLGIEKFLTLNFKINGETFISQPSPFTAANFLLTSIMILLIFVSGKKQRLLSLAGGIGFIVLIITLTIIIKFLYCLPLFSIEKARPMTFTSAGAFLFLNAGLIAIIGPNHFPLRLLVGKFVRIFLLITMATVLSCSLICNLLPEESKINYILLFLIVLSLIFMEIAGVIIVNVLNIFEEKIKRERPEKKSLNKNEEKKF